MERGLPQSEIFHIRQSKKYKGNESQKFSSFFRMK